MCVKHASLIICFLLINLWKYSLSIENNYTPASHIEKVFNFLLVQTNFLLNFILWIRRRWPWGPYLFNFWAINLLKCTLLFEHYTPASHIQKVLNFHSVQRLLPKNFLMPFKRAGLQKSYYIAQRFLSNSKCLPGQTARPADRMSVYFVGQNRTMGTKSFF